MLFVKKTRFSLSEKQIKEELTAPDGGVALVINLRYPQINCPKKDPLAKNAMPFYPRLAEGFADYAKTDLLKTAIKAKKEDPENFKPFSAVMSFETTFENEKYLSVAVELSVSDGKSPPMRQKKTQVWERKYGTKCPFTEFFDTKDIPRLIENYIGKENRKRFEREVFTINEKGFEFYISAANEYETFFVPISESNNTAK